MKTLQTLIDMARAKVHSDAELARRLGIDAPTFNHYKTGKRTISPEFVASLCDVLELPGEEAREWLAIAIIENPKNASKRSLLERAFFGWWALGVVAAALISPPNDAAAAQKVASARQSTSFLATAGDKQLPLSNLLSAHCRKFARRVIRAFADLLRPFAAA